MLPVMQEICIFGFFFQVMSQFQTYIFRLNHCRMFMLYIKEGDTKLYKNQISNG